MHLLEFRTLRWNEMSDLVFAITCFRLIVDRRCPKDAFPRPETGSDVADRSRRGEAGYSLFLNEIARIRFNAFHPRKIVNVSGRDQIPVKR